MIEKKGLDRTMKARWERREKGDSLCVFAHRVSIKPKVMENTLTEGRRRQSMA